MQSRFFPVVLLVPLLLAPLASAANAPAPGASTWVDAAFDLAQPDLRHLVLTGVVHIHLLPIDQVPTTALQFTKNYDRAPPATRADLLGKLTTSAQAGLQENLQAAFPHANVTVGTPLVDTASLVNTPGRTDYAPVNMTVSAQVVRSADDPTLAGVTDEQLATVFAIGAQVRSALTLTSQAGYDTTFALHPPAVPAGLVFAGPTVGALSPDGKTWSLAIENAAGSTSKAQAVAITVKSANAPTFSAQKADLGVVIDLKDLDVSIGKAVNRDFGNLLVDVTVTGKLNVLSVPDSFKARMGDTVKLDFLSSDGLRLLKQSGLLSASNLTAIENELRARLADNLKNALGQSVSVTGSFDAATLDPALVAVTPTGDKPVTFTAHASFTKPLSGSAPSTQALALYTVHQSFALPKVQGLDTTYTIILPRGLALAGVDAPGATTTTGTASDGRDEFSATPNTDSTTASVAIALTPTFVFLKFWPLVIFAVVLLVLIIGTPIALVVARRGKNKAK